MQNPQLNMSDAWENQTKISRIDIYSPFIQDFQISSNSSAHDIRINLDILATNFIRGQKNLDLNTFSLIIISIHDISTANRMADQTQEAKWQTKQNSC